jgi:hypothetical protein
VGPRAGLVLPHAQNMSRSSSLQPSEYTNCDIACDITLWGAVYIYCTLFNAIQQNFNIVVSSMGYHTTLNLMCTVCNMF